MVRRSEEGRLPDFVGIGAMKSASAWLYECLIAHPEVTAPRRKELHFFSDSRAYGKGIRHYAAAFRDCPIERLTGEFTPAYMFVPETAARIRRWLPQVKIIACLRDPVERAFSHYGFALRLQSRLSYYSSFEDAIETDHELFHRGLYGEQLQRYYDVFPANNILVLMHDEAQADPAKMIRQLYDFIGLSDTSFLPPSTFGRVHATKELEFVERVPLANRMLYSLRHRVQSGGALERLAFASGAAGLARRVIVANRSRVASGTIRERPEPALRPETLDRLHALYREDGQRLRRLLGRDIPWLS